MSKTRSDQEIIRRGKRALVLVEEVLVGPLDEGVIQASVKKNMAFLRDLQVKLANEPADALP